MKKLTDVSSIVEAEVIKSMLNANGIDAIINQDLPHIRLAGAVCFILVPEDDYDKAKELIESAESD